MAKTVTNRPLVLSVLDRLLDDDPDNTREAQATPVQTMRDLKRAVRRDLESLLNTRVRLLSWPSTFTELNRSLVNYGLPDFTSANMASSKDRDAFCRVIQNVILQFEPRLARVRVSPISATEPLDRTFRFRIDAELKTEPSPEPVVFDSNVEPGTGDVKVREAAR